MARQRLEVIRAEQLRASKSAGRIQIRLNLPQWKTHQKIEPGNTVALPWGRGVGKSWFIGSEIFQQVAKWDGVVRKNALTPLKGVRQVLMLPTFKQAKDLYAQKLDDSLGPHGEWGFLRAKIDHTTWRIVFPGGSWVQLFGATAAHTSRGIRCDIVWGDECDDIDVSIFDSVISPWFSEPWSLKMRVLGGTPRRGRKGLLYRTYRRASVGTEDSKARHYAFKATGYDTPDTVDREYLDQMRDETPIETFKREYLCDFDSAEGLVYPMFIEDFHVREPHPETRFTELIGGIDHGYRDPGVLLVGGVFGSGRDSGVHIVDEVYETQQTESFWIEQALRLDTKYGRKIKWFADPSQPARIEAMRKAGLNVEPGENGIEDGVSSVADAMIIRSDAAGNEWSQVYVSADCRNCIREIGAYRHKHDPHERERILEAIEDRNNHAMDALRYMIFTRFGGPGKGVADTSAGDFEGTL